MDVVLCQIKDRLLQTLYAFNDFVHPSFDIQMHISRYLIIPAPCGMELTAGITDLFNQSMFDIHMDILTGDRKLGNTIFVILKDCRQSIRDLPPLVVSDDPLFSQHCRVCYTSCYIHFNQRIIKMDGRVELVHPFNGFTLESAAPCLFSHRVSLHCPTWISL